MARLTIRNLDDDVKERLRARAAENGRSMEAEAREILSDVVSPKPGRFSRRLEKLFDGLGGDELEIPPRNDMPRIPDLG